MAKALGPRGVVARLRQATTPVPAAPPPPNTYAFGPPAALEAIQLEVGVMLHVFYADLLDEFAQALAAMPRPYTLLVSVTERDTAAVVERRFSGLPNLTRLRVEVVPNRGRDIAPFLTTFRDDILALDVVAHLHTKKSLYTGSVQDGWRRYLVHALFGDARRIGWQLGMFAAEPRLGLIYPDSYESVPLWAHTWLSNLEKARTLGHRLGVGVAAGSYLDFPAGSMFWARVDALRPLFDLGLETNEFPDEQGQVDGTLQHAIERLLVPVVRSRGYLAGVLPQGGTLTLATEGDRNWRTYFETPLGDRLRMAAIDAKLITVDVFDTLAVRPFLSADGARAYLARLAEAELAVEDFVSLRERAESRARSTLGGRDPTLREIYAALAAMDPELPTEPLRILEETTEARLLQAREGVLDALSAAARGRRVAALSDMYLDASTLRAVLPSTAASLPSTWYVSCETGWRKDTGSAWTQLPKVEGLSNARWLHVGDNEQSDVQVPQWHGLLTPVHILRPGALLDVVPGLRPLRPQGVGAGDWCEQLRLGLVANHFANLADRTPHALAPRVVVSPDSFGYCVLGPLVLDYLAWLVRVATARGARRVLFLSREGHLLHRAFGILHATTPGLSDALQGHYLLASRQAAGLAAPATVEDLPDLFDGTYNGPLMGLLRARLGAKAAEETASLLAPRVLEQEIFLPEMHAEVVEMLSPAHATLLRLSAEARAAYRDYWQREAGAEPVLLADIGYSGTIQRHLAKMLGRPLDGAYFALNARAASLHGYGWAAGRYHDGRHPDAGPSTILRNDLLLESVLTAPHPQFAGFVADGAGYLPQHAAPDVAPEQWPIIAQTHEGALRFVRDACTCAAPLVAELEFDAEAVQIPLDCVGSGLWDAPWLHGLEVEDAFTGRGRVAAQSDTRSSFRPS
ncbi:rhamnan synthesis F family protein [Coralloluteibacterium thermophilus]|uniref:Rhamnan synthesis F family protein n=1 Tax=Coralloluteibacterium thermophilum TaxID=2707049 RepID=A0ABV9NII1_9GAMM